MKKYVFGLGAIIAPSLLGAFMVAGCGSEDKTGGGLLPDADEICGPCGAIATGDIGISGDARLDGFFKALGNVQGATVSIQSDFDANIRALAATFDVDLTGEIDAAAVAQLTAKIRADIQANVEGNLEVNYQPPKCQANLDVSVEAEAKCEVKAGCTIKADPGEASVSCQGSCSGGCEGECTGDLSCEINAPSIACNGSCEGACALETAGECGGTCRGDCDGECSFENADGSCAGTCDGECTGTCELTVAAHCEGSCTGKCLVDQGDAQCTGSVSCRGSCSAGCTGSCEGNFTPPSASAECDAAADCQASAKAEANASLECTPPKLDIDFAFSASASASIEAQAAFRAKLADLKVRGVAIVQGAARYEALLTGKVEGRVVFNPSPVADLSARVQGFANESAFADFDIPAAKIPCAVAAFRDAGGIITGFTTNTAATLQAQAAFVSKFTTGFSS